MKAILIGSGIAVVLNCLPVMLSIFRFFFFSICGLRWYLSCSMVKNLPSSAGDADLIPGSGRSPGEGNGNPLQYRCLVNPRDRGAWKAIVHGVAEESDTTERLNNSNICHLYLIFGVSVTSLSHVRLFCDPMDQGVG